MASDAYLKILLAAKGREVQARQLAVPSGNTSCAEREGNDAVFPTCPTSPTPPLSLTLFFLGKPQCTGAKLVQCSIAIRSASNLREFLYSAQIFRLAWGSGGASVIMLSSHHGKLCLIHEKIVADVVERGSLHPVIEVKGQGQCHPIWRSDDLTTWWLPQSESDSDSLMAVAYQDGSRLPSLWSPTKMVDPYEDGGCLQRWRQMRLPIRRIPTRKGYNCRDAGEAKPNNCQQRARLLQRPHSVARSGRHSGWPLEDVLPRCHSSATQLIFLNKLMGTAGDLPRKDFATWPAPRRNRRLTSPSPLPGTMRSWPPYSPFLQSREWRQRRDLLASQTSSRLLEFPICLTTMHECSGETGWRLSPPRRITRVGEDSRWWPKKLYILTQPSGRQSLMEAAWQSVRERREVRTTTGDCVTTASGLNGRENIDAQRHLASDSDSAATISLRHLTAIWDVIDVTLKYDMRLARVLQTVECMGYFPCSDNKAVVPPNEALRNSYICPRRHCLIGRHACVDCMYFGQTYLRISKKLLRDNANLHPKVRRLLSTAADNRCQLITAICSEEGNAAELCDALLKANRRAILT
ncbi:hypothetical protein PR048_013654 [Dryococelus australis]|uniref:Uncharacterized protein n=1 Tax=Dryococelus australis TaxID=614101 RepID=A0ABQ9HTM1_9NEOP|nr:hypothetical protein PR048_013654 [Dryococelus australis]